MTDQRKNRQLVQQRGSDAVDALETAWRAVREVEPRVPQAVIVIIGAPARSRSLGHFAHSSWKVHGTHRAHEIGINPKLFRNPRDLLATMLHEAAHAILHEVGRRGGVGSTRYYHTKEFRECCNELGLECGFLNTRYGWTLTRWPDEGRVPKRYFPVLSILRDALPAGTAGKLLIGRTGRSLPRSGHVRAICGCTKPRSIYLSSSSLEQGGIACTHCGREFHSANLKLLGSGPA